MPGKEKYAENAENAEPQYSGTLCSWHAVQLKGNVYCKILSQLWEQVFFAEPTFNLNRGAGAWKIS